MLLLRAIAHRPLPARSQGKGAGDINAEAVFVDWPCGTESSARQRDARRWKTFARLACVGTFALASLAFWTGRCDSGAWPTAPPSRSCLDTRATWRVLPSPPTASHSPPGRPTARCGSGAYVSLNAFRPARPEPFDKLGTGPV